MKYRFAYKLRFIKTFGAIIHKEKEYIFRPMPGKGCPILEMRDKSKWNLVEDVYYIINYRD